MVLEEKEMCVDETKKHLGKNIILGGKHTPMPYVRILKREMLTTWRARWVSSIAVELHMYLLIIKLKVKLRPCMLGHSIYSLNLIDKREFDENAKAITLLEKHGFNGYF